MGRITNEYKAFKAATKVFMTKRTAVTVAHSNNDAAIREVETQIKKLSRDFETFLETDHSKADIEKRSKTFGNTLKALNAMLGDYKGRIETADRAAYDAYADVQQHIQNIGALMAEKGKAGKNVAGTPKYIKIYKKIVAFHKNTAPKKV
ncbi:MAG: hypothetical protein AB8B51_08710 [Sedimentitalea sp.]